MKQDFELKFDDDKESQKVSLDTETGDKSKESLNNPRASVDEGATIPIRSDSIQTSEKIEPQNISNNLTDNTLEITNEQAYKTGVLVIGIPILIVLTILGLTTGKAEKPIASQKKTSSKSQENVSATKASQESQKENVSSTSNKTSNEIYTVKPGDTLFGIGLDLKIDWKELAELNNIEPPYALKSGQELKLPK